MYKIIAVLGLMLLASPALSVSVEYRYTGAYMRGYGSEEGKKIKGVRMSLLINERLFPDGSIAGKEITWHGYSSSSYPEVVSSFWASPGFPWVAENSFKFTFDDDKRMNSWIVFADDDCDVTWGSGIFGDNIDYGHGFCDGIEPGGFNSVNPGRWSTPTAPVPLPLG
jgi:hypothetical protein